MRRIRGGRFLRFGFFWTLMEEVKIRTDGIFSSGRKKGASRNAVYVLGKILLVFGELQKRNPEEGKK